MSYVGTVLYPFPFQQERSKGSQIMIKVWGLSVYLHWHCLYIVRVIAYIS